MSAPRPQYGYPAPPAPPPDADAAEIAAIRSELQRLQTDVAGDTTTAQQRHELEDDVATLYRQLQRAAGELEAERASRQASERQLEALRVQRLDDAASVVAELEARRGELAELRRERGQMKEWLDRGVAECRRVADDAAALSGELGGAERECAALRDERRALGATVEALGAELRDVQSGLEASHRERERGEARAAAAADAVAAEEQRRREAVSECERLAADVARLSHRAKGLEESELALYDTCRSLAALVAEVDATERAVALCDLDGAPARAAAADTGAVGAGERRPAVPALCLDAQQLLQAMRAAAERLRASVTRYVADRQAAHAEMDAAHRAAVAELGRERDAAAATHEAEAEALRRRVADLEREIVLVADGVQRDVAHEAHDRLAALDELTRENRGLTERAAEAAERNAALRAQVQRMKLDWGKVDTSRRRYHQLETEMGILREHHARLQQENRNLTALLDSRAAACDAPPPSLSEQRHSTLQRQAFESWRTRMMTAE